MQRPNCRELIRHSRSVPEFCVLFGLRLGEYTAQHGQPYRISHPPRPAVSPEPRLAGAGALPDAPGAPGSSRVRFSTRRHAHAHSRLLGTAVSGPARSGPPQRLGFSRKPHPGAVAVPVRRLSACVTWVFQCPIGCLQPLTTISECRPLLSPRASPGTDSHPGHGRALFRTTCCC